MLLAPIRLCRTAVIFTTLLVFAAAHAAAPIDVPVPGFADKYAQVNGVRIHYKIGGKGTPVLLLHGYGETGHM